MPNLDRSQTNRTGYNAELVTMESISRLFPNVLLPTSYLLYPELPRIKTIQEGSFWLKIVSVQTA